MVRDHSERLALLAGLRGDDRRVQREQIRLLVDRADYVQELANAADARDQLIDGSPCSQHLRANLADAADRLVDRTLSSRGALAD